MIFVILISGFFQSQKSKTEAKTLSARVQFTIKSIRCPVVDCYSLVWWQHSRLTALSKRNLLAMRQIKNRTR